MLTEITKRTTLGEVQRLVKKWKDGARLECVHCDMDTRGKWENEIWVHLLENLVEKIREDMEG